MTGKITIAAGAGFAGDRVEPAAEFARSGLVDAVGLECLAERTLVAGLLERRADSSLGYDRRLRRRLAPLLPAAKASGCRVVTNLGSANPAAAAEAVAGLARELGLPELRVAAVLGDDVAAHAESVTWADPAASSRPDDWLGVHAYLGMAPIVEALTEGADVVVTGRVADSALFAAPAAATLDLDEPALAGVLTAGHLLECSGQLTGGNLADLHTPPLPPETYARLGYPLARITADGTAELSVLKGKPARLDTIACTLQLLYEVHDPSAYLTPDATLDFSDVAFEQLGENRVRVSGSRSGPRPERLKAVGFRQGSGVLADVEIAYAGAGCEARAAAAGETMRIRLGGLGVERLQVDYVGVDSVLGAATRLAAAEPPEVRTHVSAVCESAELAQAVEDELYALTLSGPAGGCGMRSERRPHLQVETGLIDRDEAPTRIEWHPA